MRIALAGIKSKDNSAYTEKKSMKWNNLEKNKLGHNKVFCGNIG